MRDILLQGIAILLAITVFLAAGELAFGPGKDTDIHSTAALLASMAAAGLLLFQYLYFKDRQSTLRAIAAAGHAAGELRELQERIRQLEHERLSLRSQIENLSAHREISRAATVHTSFDDFLEEIAGVVHDLAGALDLTLFVNSDSMESALPRAYYRIDRATELCLTFSDSGSIALLNEMESGRRSSGMVDAELLGATRISITPRGAEIIVGGSLMLRNQEIGVLRQTLRQFDPEQPPSADIVSQLVATELGHVRLNNRDVLQAMIHQKPLHYDANARLVDLACPLITDGEQIGVIKVKFDCHADPDKEQAMQQRRKLLQESATHIAHAIRSERIYQQAIRDGLTGLYNKQYMMTQLDGYFNVADRHQTHLSLIMLDIDHFKHVNDTYGHLTGDIILRDVSAILLDSIRTSDLACRYGGEELAVILPTGNLQGSIEVAERIRVRIETKTFHADDGRVVPLTASLGVAEFSTDMRRVEDLIARTDAALYQAKEGGRNQVKIWRPDNRNARQSSPPRDSGPSRRRKTNRKLAVGKA